MKGEKNPNDIFGRYQNGELDRKSIIEILKSLIDNGTSISQRSRSIELLGRLISSGNELLKIFENCMISDISPVVRSAAVKILVHNFLEVGLRSLSWVIKNDPSNLVLRTIIELLEERDNDYILILRNEILQRFSRIFQVTSTEAKFFVELFILLDKLGEPMDISINYVDKFSFRTSSFHYCTTAGYKPKFINVRNKHVYALRLGGFKLKDLPDSIALLTRLRFLTIFKTELNDLPEFFRDLQNLMCLRLVSNKFKKLPISISKLKKLKSLVLEEQDLKTLPSWIGKLPSLRFLNVSSRNIKKIPNSLYKLSKHKFAQKYIKAGVDQDEAPILGLLELLIGTRLEKIENFEDEFNSEKYDLTHSMCNFKLNKTGNIVRIYLYFSGPALGMIPGQICLLKRIERIHICDSTIENIPKNIGNLKSLKILDLSANLIKKIPRSIKKLKNIQQIDLSYNRIIEIPTFMKNHPILKKIDLIGNPVYTSKMRRKL